LVEFSAVARVGGGEFVDAVAKCFGGLHLEVLAELLAQ
jgi:hypothetical protein